MIVPGPAATPKTVPPDDTVAVAGVPLVQVPPVVISPSVMLDPVHTVVGPVITCGNGLTSTGAEVLQPVLSV